MKALPRFRPSCGSLESYIFINARNQSINDLRRIARYDSPCKPCQAGNTCGPDGEQCKRFKKWSTGQKAKNAIYNAFSENALGVAPSEVLDRQRSLQSNASGEADVEAAELLEIIRRELPPSMLETYEKIRNGDPVPWKERRRVEAEVLEILDVYGVSREELGLPPDEMITTSRRRKATEGRTPSSAASPLPVEPADRRATPPRQSSPPCDRAGRTSPSPRPQPADASATPLPA
jgi:hypothetical protein